MNKSIEEKKLYLEEHFYYETIMMLFCYQKSNNVKYVTTDFRENNLALEGFLLHTRGLIEFFFLPPVKKYKDDARASEFVINWDTLKPTYIQKMKTIKNRIDKELAHLTWKRKNSNNSEKLWAYGEIYNKMFETLKTFLKELPNNLKEKNMHALSEAFGLTSPNTGLPVHKLKIN